MLLVLFKVATKWQLAMREQWGTDHKVRISTHAAADRPRILLLRLELGC